MGRRKTPAPDSPPAAPVEAPPAPETPEAPPAPILAAAPFTGELPPPPAPEAEPGPGEPAPRRRKKRKPAEPEPLPPTITPEEAARLRASFVMLFMGLSWVAAKRYGPKWALTEEEQGKLGEAWAQGVEPWVTGWIAKASPLAAAVGLTAAIVIQRVQGGPDVPTPMITDPPTGPRIVEDTPDA